MEWDKLQALLARHGVWLLRHSRAAALDCQGYDAEDLMHDALVVAMKYMARGWFDRAPHVSLDAQERALLRLSMKRAKHNWIRARARRGALERPVPNESAGGWERIVSEDLAIDPHFPVLAVGDFIVSVRGLASALHRLALLAFHAPFDVKRTDIEDGAPESRVPVRQPQEAWSLFQKHVPAWTTLPQADWRLLVAEIVRSPKAMGEASPEERTRLLNAMESHASSGTQILLAAFAKVRVEGGE